MKSDLGKRSGFGIEGKIHPFQKKKKKKIFRVGLETIKSS